MPRIRQGCRSRRKHQRDERVFRARPGRIGDVVFGGRLDEVDLGRVAAFDHDAKTCVREILHGPVDEQGAGRVHRVDRRDIDARPARARRRDVLDPRLPAADPLGDPRATEGHGQQAILEALRNMRFRSLSGRPDIAFVGT